jgi:hypothetical protein
MLAVDIDDTIVDTALHVIRVIHGQFGHSLSPDDLRFNYKQPGSVPQWQTAPVQKAIKDIFDSSEFLSQLEPKQAASKILHQAHKTSPISCYITSRESKHQTATQKWLRTHAFPKAPVITRETNEIRMDWKLHHLANNFPDVKYLLDDTLVPQVATFPRLQLIWLSTFANQNVSLPANVVRLDELEHLAQTLSKLETVSR